MKKYGLQIVILLLRILSFIKITELKEDLVNPSSYLSEKIDNLTTKVNMLSVE